MLQYFRTDELVTFSLRQVDECRLGHFVKRLAILLSKGQKEAMPSHWQLTLKGAEGEQVLRKSRQNSFGKCVMLVEQGCQVVSDGSGWRQIHEFEHGHRGTDHRNGHFGQKRFNHLYFPQQSILIAKFEEYSFKPGICFIKSFFQGIVKMDIEFLVIPQISANCRYKPYLIEFFSPYRVKVGGKDVNSLSHGLRSPLIRSGESQHFPPPLKIRDNLERLGNLSTPVPIEYFPYFSINSFHFRVIKRFVLDFFQFSLQCILPISVGFIRPESQNLQQSHFSL